MHKLKTFSFSLKLDNKKVIKNKEGKEKKQIEFQELNGVTTTNIYLDSIFSEENMRNNFYLMDWSSAFFSDNSRLKSVRVDENHLGEEGKADFYPDTYLQDLWMYLNSGGYKDVMGIITSTNPDFAELAKRATGVSVVLEAPDFAEWFVVEIPLASGETKEIIMASQAKLRSIAILTGDVHAGSGGSRIGGKEFITQGSRAAPDMEEISENFKHIQDMTEEQIKKTISDAIAGFKQELEAKDKVTFEIKKDEIKEGKVVTIDGQEFKLAKVETQDDQEDETAEVAEFLEKLQKNKELAKEIGKHFTEKVGEEGNGKVEFQPTKPSFFKKNNIK